MITKVLDYFSALIAGDDSIPLTETALPIAQDAYLDLDPQAELTTIDVLVTRIENYIAEGTSAIQHLCLLNQSFYRELGFDLNANGYYDPENSYPNAVLQSRRGIPTSLAVLLMEIGQQIGLPFKGVFFSNHFLVRMNIPTGEVVLNPLTGQALSKEELQDIFDPYLEREGAEDPNSVSLGMFLQAATHREIIACMPRNLRAIYLQKSHWQCLLAMQQWLVILPPDSTEEVHDRGLVYANLECFWPAPENLEVYVDARSDVVDTAKLKECMPTLRTMSKNLN